MPKTQMQNKGKKSNKNCMKRLKIGVKTNCQKKLD